MRLPPSAQQMAYQPMGAEILPVTIGVTDYAIAPNGSFSVTLDNGQVWRERNEHYDHPAFRSDSKHVVVIEHAVWSKYSAEVENKRRTCSQPDRSRESQPNSEASKFSDVDDPYWIFIIPAD